MNESVAVIDFGTSKIVTVVARPQNNERLSILGHGSTPYDGFMETQWNIPRQMVQRIRASVSAAEKSANTSIKQVYVGVPGGFMNVETTLVTIESDAPMQAEDCIDLLMDKAADELGLRHYNGWILHRTASWYRLDDGEMTMMPKGDCRKIEAKISFVTAMECFVEDVSEMMGVMGITILGFVSSNYGADLLISAPDERDNTVTVIDCGYLNTDVTVMHGDGIVYHAVVPFGGGHITRDLSEFLQIRLPDAEKIKREFNFDPDEWEINNDVIVVEEENTVRLKRRVVAEIIEKAVAEWVDYMSQVFEMDVDPLITQTSKVYLTGGGLAKMRGSLPYLSAKLGRKIEACPVRSASLNGPEFTSALGTIDTVFDALGIECETKEQTKNGFGSLFGKFKTNKPV